MGGEKFHFPAKAALIRVQKELNPVQACVNLETTSGCKKLTRTPALMLRLKRWHRQSQEDRQGRGCSLSSRRLAHF
jgi:hypothetical protein